MANPRTPSRLNGTWPSAGTRGRKKKPDATYRLMARPGSAPRLAPLPARQKVVQHLGVRSFARRPDVRPEPGLEIEGEGTLGPVERDTGVAGPEPLRQSLFLD